MVDDDANAQIGEKPAPGPPLALTSFRMALNFVKSVKLDGANPWRSPGVFSPPKATPMSRPSVVIGAPSSPG